MYIARMDEMRMWLEVNSDEDLLNHSSMAMLTLASQYGGSMLRLRTTPISKSPSPHLIDLQTTEQTGTSWVISGLDENL